MRCCDDPLSVFLCCLVDWIGISSVFFAGRPRPQEMWRQFWSDVFCRNFDILDGAAGGSQGRGYFTPSRVVAPFHPKFSAISFGSMSLRAQWGLCHRITSWNKTGAASSYHAPLPGHGSPALLFLPPNWVRVVVSMYLPSSRYLSHSLRFLLPTSVQTSIMHQ